jgi:protein gp37
MAQNSNIEWTDNTWNPWIGCTKVSPGCANCYAEARDQRFAGGAHWGKGAPRQRTSAANWKQPLKWNREAAEDVDDALHDFGADKYEAPQRPRVFCASLADWLDDEVPIEWLADLLGLIHATPFLDWQLLTKRPENWMARIEQAHTARRAARASAGNMGCECARVDAE